MDYELIDDCNNKDNNTNNTVEINNNDNNNDNNNEKKILKKSSSENNIIMPIIKDCCEITPVEEILQKMQEYIAFLSEEVTILKYDVKKLKELNSELIKKE